MNAEEALWRIEWSECHGKMLQSGLTEHGVWLEVRPRRTIKVEA